MENNHGGARPGAGRKPIKVREELVDKLTPYDDDVLGVMVEQAKHGEPWAVKLFLEYRYGKPVQRQEISGPDGDPMVVKLPEWMDEG